MQRRQVRSFKKSTILQYRIANLAEFFTALPHIGRHSRQAHPEKQLEKKKTDNLITGWEERKESRKAKDDVGSSRKISYTAAVDFALQGFFCRGDGRL